MPVMLRNARSNYPQDAERRDGLRVDLHAEGTSDNNDKNARFVQGTRPHKDPCDALEERQFAFAQAPQPTAPTKIHTRPPPAKLVGDSMAVSRPTNPEHTLSFRELLQHQRIELPLGSLRDQQALFDTKPQLNPLDERAKINPSSNFPTLF
jgi:hypothetical protein